MPGNLPPDFLQAALHVGGLILAGLVGTAARIFEQIESGERERVWTRALIVDTFSFVLLVFVAAGIAEFFDAGPVATAALGGVFCRSGTPILDSMVKGALGWFRRPWR